MSQLLCLWLICASWGQDAPAAEGGEGATPEAVPASAAGAAPVAAPAVPAPVAAPLAAPSALPVAPVEPPPAASSVPAPSAAVVRPSPEGPSSVTPTRAPAPVSATAAEPVPSKALVNREGMPAVSSESGSGWASPFAEPPAWFSTPQRAPETTVVMMPESASDAGWQRVMPWIPARGGKDAFGLGVVTALCWTLAWALSQLLLKLRPKGLLPSMARVSEVVARLAALFFGVGAVGALVPAAFAPVLPLVLVGVALAVGWSARELLADIVAGLLFAIEGKVRPGQWLSTPVGEGTVIGMGVRATWLRDGRDRAVAIPHRVLATQTTRTDDRGGAWVEVALRVPAHVHPKDAREGLFEAVMLTPWVATSQRPLVSPDPEEDGRWRVRARLIDGRFRDAFESSLRSRVLVLRPDWHGAAAAEAAAT